MAHIHSCRRANIAIFIKFKQVPNHTIRQDKQGATKVVVLLSRTWEKCLWTSEPSYLLVTSGFENFFAKVGTTGNG